MSATLAAPWRERILARPGPLVVVGAFALSLAVAIVVLASLHVPPGQALSVMADGAFGSPASLADTLVFMTPRLLVALGALVALRCGLFNLGGEGQMQAGAVGAILPATLLPPGLGFALLPLSLLGAAIGGALWAAIAAWLRERRGANEIISTLMLNFIAVDAVRFLCEGPLQPKGSDFNMSAAAAPGAVLPVLLGGTRLHAGVLLALLAAFGVFVLLRRTVLGVRLRATGLAPRTARLVGMKVGRLLALSFLLSGALGGLAGATEVLGVHHRLIEGFSGGIGFDGLAVAFLAGLEPIPAIAVAFCFGAIDAGTLALQSRLGVPSAIASVLTGLPIVILAAVQGLLLLRGRTLWASD